MVHFENQYNASFSQNAISRYLRNTGWEQVHMVESDEPLLWVVPDVLKQTQGYDNLSKQNGFDIQMVELPREFEFVSQSETQLKLISSGLYTYYSFAECLNSVQPVLEMETRDDKPYCITSADLYCATDEAWTRFEESRIRREIVSFPDDL